MPCIFLGGVPWQLISIYHNWQQVSTRKSSKTEDYMILGYIWCREFDPDQCRYKEKEAPWSCSSDFAGSGSDSIMHFSQQVVALPDQFYPGKSFFYQYGFNSCCKVCVLHYSQDADTHDCELMNSLIW